MISAILKRERPRRMALLLLLLATFPLSGCEQAPLVTTGTFQVVYNDPIYQDITRIAFLCQDGNVSGDYNIHFSTLESYHVNPEGDRFVIYKYDMQTGQLDSIVINGSIEARSEAYSELLNKHILGASLDPQILLYDPSNQSFETIFKKPGAGAWIHAIATQGDFAYTILSTPSSPVEGFNGILKVNIVTKDWSVIPFADEMAQNWGGVQTIDPTGRIWFYRSFPLSLRWYDEVGGMRERAIAGYEDWTIESWDKWGDSYFLIMADDDGNFLKVRVDLFNLTLRDSAVDYVSEEERLFMDLIPVDFYHQGNEFVSSVYYHPRTSDYYKIDNEKQTMLYLGNRELGKCQVLGLGKDDNLIMWLQGQKTYGIADLNTGDITFEDIKAPNLSPANITSLAISEDGYLYGGGYLTWSHLFRYDLASGEVTILEQAVPDAEGEVTSLFIGLDSNIYGAVYPGSVIFKYDPDLPWNPGEDLSSNPVNVGPMGYYNQTSALRGVQDLDGNIWYQSRNDYHELDVHALARIDFNTLTMVVKTDKDDGFPIVKDLAVYDNEHIALVGEDGGKYKLFLLDQRQFEIEQERELPKSGGVLVNLDPQNASQNNLYLAQENVIYKVGDDLSLSFMHESIQPILKILPGWGDDIILLGRNHIEMINSQTGNSKIWWEAKDADTQEVFSSLTWLPAVFHNGEIYIGYDWKILKFVPPGGYVSGAH